ncbi:creatininase family protein [archaeon]|jgi:creatinine amidohydrolase|nr:creatininase family protein [archaeon]MBT4022833.1 creatininase family protein [archaeon]MBT4272973.1 creatininase family protein [archaeon]MBT4460936.1 creatininase family protein [archaeon]MBT4858036.1 creatininase family protein [archaeon]
MVKVIELIDLTKSQLDKLNRNKTIFVSAISPIEVHGPHLPLGSDLMAAREIMKRTCQKIKNYDLIHIEDLAMGAHVMPAGGSFPVHYRTLKKIIVMWATKLQEMGFKHWLIFNGHGAANQILALCEASTIMKKKGFNLIIPFLTIFHESKKLNEDLKLSKEFSGGMIDYHAGTNETSLLLAIDEKKVAKDYKKYKKYFPKFKSKLGNFIRLFGEKDMGTVCDWVEDPKSRFYLGDPSKANKKIGEKFLEYNAIRSYEIFNDSIKKGYVPPKYFSPFMKFMLKITPEW